MRPLLILFSILFVNSVMAKTLHFKCEGTYRISNGATGEFDENYAVDMTNKTWETEDHIFDDVLVSPSQISVKGSDYSTSSMQRTYNMQISRVDLSFTKKTAVSVTEELANIIPPTSMDHTGQCEIVEAPKVERAF